MIREFPLFIVNLKNYKQASGDNILKFLEAANVIRNKLNINILIALPHLELYYYVRNYKQYTSFLMAQSFDVIEYGGSTGHIPLMKLYDFGIRYSLLNHSENKVDLNKLIELYKGLIKIPDFKVIICVDSIDELKRLINACIKPYAYAIEPPELIGTGRSVSKYKPEVISEAVSIGRRYGLKILCGAGVSNREDVIAALRLGADGILVASAIAKQEDPYDKMYDMALGLLNV